MVERPDGPPQKAKSMTTATNAAKLLNDEYAALLNYMAGTKTMPLVGTAVENGVTVKTFQGAYGPVTFLG